MVNYTKLKTSLRLSIQRLKLLEKKKTELALKSRKEIADYLSAGKHERAKIRVEHIIREDYLVEAMEIVEMYCDLLLARFGLVQQMSQLDEGLSEAVSSLLWVAPRLQTDCQELKTISDLLSYKYGKQYAFAAKENAMKSVNEKLMRKMSVEAPPKILVENYLVEIAKTHNVAYEPDPDVMIHESIPDNPLIDFGEEARNCVEMPSMPMTAGTSMPAMPPPLPLMPPVAGTYTGATQPIGFNLPPSHPGSVISSFPSEKGSVSSKKESFPATPAQPSIPNPICPPVGPPPNYDAVMGNSHAPTPAPRTGSAPGSSKLIGFDGLTLPDVPTMSPNSDEKSDPNDPNDNIDFDDLTKRFEALKKRK